MHRSLIFPALIFFIIVNAGSIFGSSSEPADGSNSRGVISIEPFKILSGFSLGYFDFMAGGGYAFLPGVSAAARLGITLAPEYHLLELSAGPKLNLSKNYARGLSMGLLPGAAWNLSTSTVTFRLSGDLGYRWIVPPGFAVSIYTGVEIGKSFGLVFGGTLGFAFDMKKKNGNE